MSIKSTFIVLLAYLLIKAFYILLMDTQAEVNVVDVGQGDAIFIRTRSNRKIVIDGGPDYEIDSFLQGEDILGKCVLDLVVLTHPHTDHLRGLNRLMKRCQVKNIISNNVPHDSREYQTWMENIAENRISQGLVGDKFFIDGLTFIVLWPQDVKGVIKNINNSSVVLLLDYRKFEAIFMGDLEADASSKIDLSIIDSYVDGKVELLKVPHQGALDGHNIDLVRHLKPEVCVISVGEDNKYGHPHEEVIKSLNSTGCTVRLTSEEGNVRIPLK